MKITCIADLHGELPELPGGDLLLMAGDYTGSNKVVQWMSFFNWIKKQQYRKIVAIAGNHDGFLQCCVPYTEGNFEYLSDSGTEFEGIKIYGSPWNRTFSGINAHCTAFTYADETWFFDEKVAKIPTDTDILLTHTPAYGRLDVAKGKNLGSTALASYLTYMGRPKLHVFGHIHEGYGQEEKYCGCLSINCSHMNGDYEAVNAPITIEL